MSDEKKRLWLERPYRDGDEDKLSVLYGDAVGEWIGFDAWRWLFLDAPAGKGYTWFADHDGFLAGQYSIIPVDMMIQGKRVRASQSVDTMTHSNYRKQGIFLTLARNVYEMAKSDNVSLVYGFPNQNSIHGLTEHLGFTTLNDVKKLMRPIKTDDAIASKLKIPVIPEVMGYICRLFFDLIFPVRTGSQGDIEIKSATLFPDETDKLFESVSGNFPNMVIRDTRYLNWRYCDRPNREYEILLAYRGNVLCGYCVTGTAKRHGYKVGYIMDIFANPSDSKTISILIGNAVKAMLRRNIVAMTCLITGRSPFVKFLRKAGFIFRIPGLSYNVKVLSSEDIDLEKLKDVSQWHITFGDTDFT